MTYTNNKKTQVITTIALLLMAAAHSFSAGKFPASPEPQTPPKVVNIENRQDFPTLLEAKKKDIRSALNRDKTDKTNHSAAVIKKAAKELFDAHPVVFDWFLQDINNQLKTWYQHDNTNLLIQQLIDNVAGQLPDAESKGILSRKADLQQNNASTSAWFDLYFKACQLRRQNRLTTIPENWNQIVFVKHYELGGSHYAYTEGQSDAQNESHFIGGSALCVLEIDGQYGTIRTLLEDNEGVIRDPDVSYDGKRILFAWKRHQKKDDYHLYEFQPHPRRLRQITRGAGVADYEGIYLPDGDLLFNSTRCIQTVDCWWTEVSNLYTCDGRGKYLRRLSFDQVHTNYPQVMPDGRIVYTRWDYNDRGQLFPQPLFQMNPDGTEQTEYYGNNSWFPTTILHARGIPGTSKVLSVISGHHTHQRGKLGVIDPAKGRQENEGVQLIAPVRETEAVRIDQYGQNGDLFQYPYPIDEQQFLVCYSPVGDNGAHTKRHYGLYWMDIDGHREMLAYDEKLSCVQPVPLAERPKPHVRPSLVDYTQDSGVYYVHDVYIGPGLKDIERGTAKSIRVVALDFRAAGIGSNSNRGPAGSALVSTPPAINNGTWDVKKVLGTTPIYEDGSAMFTVPAKTPVYFQVLDKDNYVIQTMRSWSTLQPGEKFSCTGCHENKNEAPPVSVNVTQAMQQGPLELTPFYGPARGFSFAKEIQPILNKHCVRCHNPSGKARGYDLTDTVKVDEKAKRKWTQGYLTLTQNGKSNKWVNWISIQSEPSMLPPYHAGAAKSKLMNLINKGHGKTKLSQEEKDKIACWIDLLIPFCGDYTEANTWNDKERQKYQHFLNKRSKLEKLEEKNIRQLINDQARAND